LKPPFVAFLGGTQTFGKFVAKPYPLRVEHLTGVTSVNLGQLNAGVDVFARDEGVLKIARAARVNVLEVVGAANMTNPFYTVHPRRNDRFLQASVQLRAQYPEVDFSQFNFTQHMLNHLQRADPDRFAVLEKGLQRVWSRRMRQLVGKLGKNTVLLHFATVGEGPCAGGPMFVTPQMIATLGAQVAASVHVPVPPPDDAPDRGMVFNPVEREAARQLPGPDVHADAARLLRPVLDAMM